MAYKIIRFSLEEATIASLQFAPLSRYCQGRAVNETDTEKLVHECSGDWYRYLQDTSYVSI